MGMSTDDYILYATDADRAEFARLLKQHMKQRGWRNADLARAAFGESKDKQGRVGANNRDAVSAYVAGRTLPGAINRRKLAQALGMTEPQFESELLPHMAARRQARMDASKGAWTPPRNRRASDRDPGGPPPRPPCLPPTRPGVAEGGVRIETSPDFPGKVHVALDKWIAAPEAARLLALLVEQLSQGEGSP